MITYSIYYYQKTKILVVCNRYDYMIPAYWFRAKEFNIPENEWIKKVYIDKTDDYSYFNEIEEGEKESTDGIITIEQDIVFPHETYIDMIKNILPEDKVVVKPYQYPSTLNPRHYIHRVQEMIPIEEFNGWQKYITLKHNRRYIEKDDTKSNLYGFGCTFIRKDIWIEYSKKVTDKRWTALDSRFSEATALDNIWAKVIWTEVEHIHIT